jgi:hypothetical protein
MKYEGKFKNNYPNGKGIASYANGEKYEGEWKMAQKHGKGILCTKEINGGHIEI